MLTQRGPAPYLIYHVSGRGAIARFDQDYDQIATVLDMLKAGGADGISLSPWLWAGIGDNDQYLDWTPETGRLSTKAEQNLIVLLGCIARRFSWIQVAPQFYDPDQARVASTKNQSWPRNVGMDAFVGTALFMDWMTSVLDSLGIEWVMDLVPEFNDTWYLSGDGYQQYVKDTWARMTSLRSPGGVPCWNHSMSFTMANFDALVDAFQGNPPAILLPHPYNTDLLWLHKELDSRGLGTLPWLVGEDYTLGEAGDENYVQKYVAFVQRTRQLIMGVCPWPIPTTWKKGDSFLAPPRAPTLWNTM